MANLTDSQVRGWLVNYYYPERLADPAMRDVLRLHGRPYEGSTWAVYRASTALLREMIERLRPDPDAPSDAWRPYRVLIVSYVERQDLATTGKQLAMSTRQVTRERTRAVALLRAELEN